MDALASFSEMLLQLIGPVWSGLKSFRESYRGFECIVREERRIGETWSSNSAMYTTTLYWVKASLVLCKSIANDVVRDMQGTS